MNTDALPANKRKERKSRLNNIGRNWVVEDCPCPELLGLLREQDWQPYLGVFQFRLIQLSRLF